VKRHFLSRMAAVETGPATVPAAGLQTFPKLSANVANPAVAGGGDGMFSPFRGGAMDDPPLLVL